MGDRDMLQGVAPLTLVIPDGGVAQYVHAKQILDPEGIDEATQERLVRENFLRRVRVGADGMVTALGDDGKVDKAAPTESAGAAAQAGPVRTDDVDPEVLQRRASAAAKLPVDGSAPKNAHGEDVWMEYAVRKGMDRAEAERLGKAGLMRHYRDAGRNTKAAEGDDAELAALRKRAVEQGMDRAEVEKASADDLRALVK